MSKIVIDDKPLVTNDDKRRQRLMKWRLKLKVDDMARGIRALDDICGHESLDKPLHDKEVININDMV